MTATEDPTPPLSNQAAGAAEPSDELEHWLSDLRTEVAANPSDWIDADSSGGHPTSRVVDPEPFPHVQPETGVSEPKSIGRHRSPD